jgi:hypothetical protein
MVIKEKPCIAGFEFTPTEVVVEPCIAVLTAWLKRSDATPTRDWV